MQLSPYPFIWYITQYGFLNLFHKGQMFGQPRYTCPPRPSILLWSLNMTHKKKIVYVKFLLVFTLTWFSWKLNHLRSACWYLSFYKIWNYILQTFANARPLTNRQRNKWNGLHNPSFSGEKNEPIYSQYLSKRGPQYLGILCIRGCYVLWHSPRYHESHMSSH